MPHFGYADTGVYHSPLHGNNTFLSKYYEFFAFNSDLGCHCTKFITDIASLPARCGKKALSDVSSSYYSRYDVIFNKRNPMRDFFMKLRAYL